MKPESDTTERRCNHVLSLGDYPKQCRKCMLIVPDPMCFLGGDRRKAQTTALTMSKAREMIQSFIDALSLPDDAARGAMGSKLWAIHDEGYARCLRDNNMAPKLEDGLQ